MKFLAGVFVLAAGQAISVDAFAIRSLTSLTNSNPQLPRNAAQDWSRLRHFLPRDRAPSGNKLKARSPQEGDAASINLSTVFGTADFASSTTPAVSTAAAASDVAAISLATGLVTDNQPAPTEDTNAAIETSTTEGRRTVTVTKTEIAIVTDTETASPTTSPLQAVVQSNFGGLPGQVSANNVFTAGAVVTLGGQDSFGGVVGAVPADPPAVSTSSSTDSTSTTSGVSTSAVGVVADNVAASASEQAGAFGGVVGTQALPNNLISTVSSFNGFGGIVGIVSATSDPSATSETSPAVSTPGGYYKRDTFFATVDISDSTSLLLQI